jgi:hypothetical protein
MFVVGILVRLSSQEIADGGGKTRREAISCNAASVREGRNGRVLNIACFPHYVEARWERWERSG